LRFPHPRVLYQHGYGAGVNDALIHSPFSNTGNKPGIGHLGEEFQNREARRAG
jgi:hypothetical protein